MPCPQNPQPDLRVQSFWEEETFSPQLHVLCVSGQHQALTRLSCCMCGAVDTAPSPSVRLGLAGIGSHSHKHTSYQRTHTHTKENVNEYLVRHLCCLFKTSSLCLSFIWCKLWNRRSNTVLSSWNLFFSPRYRSVNPSVWLSSFGRWKWSLQCNVPCSVLSCTWGAQRERL